MTTIVYNNKEQKTHVSLNSRRIYTYSYVLAYRLRTIKKKKTIYLYMCIKRLRCTQLRHTEPIGRVHTK